MGIGEILKEARVANNLSLDDIQEITKIQKRYLAAIEQDDYHALPGRFYARAFIKEYAQAVGLDAQELLTDFDEEKIQTEDEQTVQYTRMERTRRTKSSQGGSSFFSFLPTVIVIILVIGIIFVAWTLYQQTATNSNVDVDDHQENDEIIRSPDETTDDQTGNARDENEEDGQAEDTEEEEQIKDEASFTVVEVGTGTSPVSELDFQYSGDQVEITFDVEQRSYLDIVGGSDTVYYGAVIEPDAENETIDVSEEERVYFNIGDVSGLTIKLNGEILEYPVDRNESVHQKLWINLKQNN